MKINWNKNPLWTSIVLDEKEIEKLEDKYFSEVLADKVYSLLWARENHPEDIVEFENNFENLREFYHNSNLHKVDTYVKELSVGIHFGDCTSAACSCIKCYAEYLLDFSTLEMFDKSSIYKIRDVFANNPNFTIDEAIDFLAGKGYEDYVSTPNENWKDKDAYMKWVPTWIEQAKIASDQLQQYKEKYLNEN